jgi:hypothetical protein
MPASDGLLIVVAVAFAAPLVLGLFPSVKLPSVVLEILASAPGSSRSSSSR